VPRRVTGAPKHRATSSPAAPDVLSPADLSPAGRHRAPRAELALGRSLRRGVVMTGVAAAATGLAVAGGLVAEDGTSQTAAAAALSSARDRQPEPGPDVRAQLEAERDTLTVSRSDRRTDVDEAKLDLLSQEAESGGQVTRSEDLASGDPRDIARAMMGEFGFSSSQFSCLDSLWMKESGWNVYADNPTSSAYGIPQSLPGSKMASAGPDWLHNPATQIRWGLGYIRDRYGSPCAAWSHSQAVNWY
jgi:hypothetical protein